MKINGLTQQELDEIRSQMKEVGDAFPSGRWQFIRRGSYTELSHSADGFTVTIADDKEKLVRRVWKGQTEIWQDSVDRAMGDLRDEVAELICLAGSRLEALKLQLDLLRKVPVVDDEVDVPVSLRRYSLSVQLHRYPRVVNFTSEFERDQVNDLIEWLFDALVNAQSLVPDFVMTKGTREVDSES